jgi:hypothetical protein
MALKMAKGMSLLIAATLLVAACAPLASRDSTTPTEPRKLSIRAHTRGWSVSAPLSIADVERPDPTSVPPIASMSGSSKRWQAFKAKMLPGDSLYFVRYAGWVGSGRLSEMFVSDSYVIVRNDVIVEELVVGET